MSNYPWKGVRRPARCRVGRLHVFRKHSNDMHVHTFLGVRTTHMWEGWFLRGMCGIFEPFTSVCFPTGTYTFPRIVILRMVNTKSA